MYICIYYIYIYIYYIYVYILNLLQTAVKLSLFEKFCPLNVKECVEDLVVHEMIFKFLDS